MTPEQFIFWLSGYFSGGRDNDDDIIVKDIRTALSKVKIDIGSITFWENQ